MKVRQQKKFTHFWGFFGLKIAIFTPKSVRTYVRSRSQNPFIGFFYFFPQTCSLIILWKWHFPFFKKIVSFRSKFSPFWSKFGLFLSLCSKPHIRVSYFLDLFKSKFRFFLTLKVSEGGGGSGAGDHRKDGLFNKFSHYFKFNVSNTSSYTVIYKMVT